MTEICRGRTCICVELNLNWLSNCVILVIQGNCKHMIVIRDMRVIHPEDVQNQADYPLLTFQIRPRYRKCSVCKIFQATKMTVDDKWAQKNPCYFCIKCYFLLHYKEDGSLLYPHTVYDYHHEWINLAAYRNHFLFNLFSCVANTTFLT